MTAASGSASSCDGYAAPTAGGARKLWLTIIAMALAAVALQLRLGVYADPLWLMTCCERWLEGQTAYVDFLDNSPPPAILLYLPPVAIARWFGVAREPLLVAYVLIVVAASLGLCARLLSDVWKGGKIGAPTLLGAAAVLLLAPDYAFGQRDHLALALALPLLSVFALRAQGGDVERWAAALAGLAGALACSIRPHYALAFAPPLAYAAWRRGVSPLFAGPELCVGALAAACAGVASFVFFPRYFDVILPIAADAYVPDTAGVAAILLTPVVATWTLLAAALLAWRVRAPANAFADVAALASMGAAAAYLIQLKGFAYHGYFAVALMFVAVTILAAAELRRPGWWILAPVANLAATLAALGNLGVPFRVDALLAGAAALAVWAGAAPQYGPPRAWVRSAASAAACAALGLIPFAFHLEWPGDPPFLAEARALGLHPKIALISDLGNLALPLVSRVDGRWTQRVISLLLTDHVDRRLARGGLDPEQRRRLEAVKALDLTTFLADMERHQPDAVIVEEGWAAAHFNAPQVRAFLAGYRRTASIETTRAGGPNSLAFYVRASRQPARGADPRGAGADRPERAGRLHLRRGGALRRRQPRRALSAFPRPRRTLMAQRRAARLRAVRGGAGARLGRRPSRPVRRARPARQGLSRVRPHAARRTIRRCSKPALPVERRFGPCAARASAPSRCCARAAEQALRHDAAGRPAAGPDGRAAHLGDGARHGVAVRRAATARSGALPMSPAELLEAQVLVYLRGLGVKAPQG